MSMFKFTEYVPANQIWPTAEVFVDNGYKPGYVRGYNIEVRKADGTTYWESACWFAEEPEEYYNDDYHRWRYEDTCSEPTGRICFRGYGEEYYDFDERDYFIRPKGQVA